MDIRECYKQIGGDFEEAFGRLMQMEKMVEKFMLKFLDDTSYELLKTSLDEGDGETAFRAAHTLKGVAQNLSFTALYKPSHEITEALRGGVITEAVPELMKKVTEEYDRTVQGIRAYQAAKG